MKTTKAQLLNKTTVKVRTAQIYAQLLNNAEKASVSGRYEASVDKSIASEEM